MREMSPEESVHTSPVSSAISGQSEQALQEVLQRCWGYSELRAMQRETMHGILAGRDCLLVMPTGGGKSLCYQVPALCLPGFAVVVSPLIALMKDQVEQLSRRGIPAAYINGSQTVEQQRRVAEQIRSGKIKLLYVAPERLVTSRMLDFLTTQPVSFFAIDEAHCVSDWGLQFRPEYRQLRILKQRFPNLGVHGFTATATREVRQDISQQLGQVDPLCLVGDSDRPNLTFRVWLGKNRIEQVTRVIQRHPGEAGIIYCISRREVERVHAILSGNGFRVGFYHAGLPDFQRTLMHNQFLRGEIDLLVATVAFGMGIDKPNVRFVVHAEVPKSLAHYQQEAGRAGRDGLPAECVLLFHEHDLSKWKMMVDNQVDQGEVDAGAVARLQRQLEQIQAYALSTGCRHRVLAEHFGSPCDRSRKCQACDLCLGEVQPVEDSLAMSRSILNGIVELDQRFGADHVSKVLSGMRDPRVVDKQHHLLASFGTLAQFALPQIRFWILQLIVQEFLFRDTAYQVLRLTPKGRDLLQHQEHRRLSALPELSDSRDSEMESAVTGASVFRAATVAAMSAIRGEVADDTVAASQAWSERKKKVVTNATCLKSFAYWDKRMGVAQVAGILGRAASTVSDFLREYLMQREIIDPTPWVTPETFARIRDAWEKGEWRGSLKETFEYFQGTISYEELAYARICLLNRDQHALSQNRQTQDA